MALTIKVRGGTPKHGKNICDTCNYSFKRIDDHGEVSQCHYSLDSRCRFLTSPVYECSGYDESGTLSKKDYLDMAWLIEVDNTGKQIGFTKYSELSDDKRTKVKREMKVDWD